MEMKTYLEDKFEVTFQEKPERFFSCGGRFEVLGNHTDHNHGLCLAATCDLSIYAAVKKRNDLIVRILSEGFGYFEISLSSLKRNNNEAHKFSSLIRGVADYLASNKYKYGGFDIYLKSNIPNGAGISSSAAFESLIGQVYNELFNKGDIPLMTLAKAGHHAEKNHYGKMCGLLDQISVSFGGISYMDFIDIINPEVEPIHANFAGYQFIIVNSGGSHAELSHLYDEIPQDMFKVADYFSKGFLREVDYEDFRKNKDDIIEKCGLTSYERSEHFFKENERVSLARQALKENNIPLLIKLMNESRKSSTNLLHNMFYKRKIGSPLEACEIIYRASNRKAGVKINGGGFAGSVIALVPNEQVKEVLKATRLRYGKENVFLVNVRDECPNEL